MQVLHAETCRDNPSCEIRIGRSSWDENELSVKFCWFTKNGQVARGGEFPLYALLQMFIMAIKRGYIKFSP